MVKIKDIIKGERGAVLVLVAGAMVGLLFFSALAIDVGFIYFQRRNLQNAADASALAAVWNPSTKQEVAEAYAAEHNVKNVADSVVASSPTSGQVRVTIENEYPRFIGIVFGSSDYRVTAEAIATYKEAWGNVAPFCPLPINYLDEGECEEYQGIDFKVRPILTEEDFEYLKTRKLANVGDDYNGDRVVRLNDFKNRVITKDPNDPEADKINIGIIASNEKSDDPNVGLLDFRGISSSVGTSTLASWLVNGYEFTIPESEEFFIDTEPGTKKSLFESSNYNFDDTKVSAIDYLMLKHKGRFYIILPHPSVDTSSPHSPMYWGDFLIAQVYVEGWADGIYTCNPSPPDKPQYFLIAELEKVFNPLEDHEELQLRKIRRVIPFLIK